MKWFIIAIIAQYVMSFIINFVRFELALADNNRDEGIPAMIKIAISIFWISVGIITLTCT